MPLTNKKISIKSVIARVYQNLGLSDEIDIGAVIEWTVDVLDKINVYPQYRERETCINVNNYKSELPCDFIELTSIEYNGQQLAKSKGDHSQSLKPSYPYYLTPEPVNFDKYINSTFIYGQLYKFKSGDSFVLKDGYLKTNFCDGEVFITYNAVETDEEGFPLIPDEVSYKEAIEWYIKYRYFYIKSLQEDRFRWFYQDAEEKYRYYINQAGANAMMPDLATLESIKDTYLRMIPNINSYKDFFKK